MSPVLQRGVHFSKILPASRDRAVEAMEPGVFDHSEEEGLAGQAKGTCLAVVWMLLPSLQSFEGQSDSGPEPRCKFQIMAGL